MSRKTKVKDICPQVFAGCPLTTEEVVSRLDTKNSNSLHPIHNEDSTEERFQSNYDIIHTSKIRNNPVRDIIYP